MVAKFQEITIAHDLRSGTSLCNEGLRVSMSSHVQARGGFIQARGGFMIGFQILGVRTSFDSNPKQEWAQVQKARTMNL